MLLSSAWSTMACHHACTPGRKKGEMGSERVCPFLLRQNPEFKLIPLGRVSHMAPPHCREMARKYNLYSGQPYVQVKILSLCDKGEWILVDILQFHPSLLTGFPASCLTKLPLSSTHTKANLGIPLSAQKVANKLLTACSSTLSSQHGLNSLHVVE